MFFPADVFMKTTFEELSYHNESSFQKLDVPLEYYYNEKGYYWVVGNNVEKNKNKNKILEKILCILKKINIKSVYNKSNVIKFKKKKRNLSIYEKLKSPEFYSYVRLKVKNHLSNIYYVGKTSSKENYKYQSHGN